MMLSEAHQLAQEYLDAYFPPSDPVRLLPDETAEDHGWCYVFRYNTRRYLETRDRDYALGPGPGPAVVMKADGKVWIAGSSHLGRQLDEYARKHGYS